MQVRIGVIAVLTVVVAISCASCGAVTQSAPSDLPSSTSPAEPATASTTPESETTTAPSSLDSLDFDDGNQIDPAAYVGWKIGSAQRPSGRPPPTRRRAWSRFVHANGACRARYIQEIIDTSATDDAVASDEFLAALTGDTVESNAPYVFDGHFALNTGLEEAAEGTVATRAILLGDEGSDMWLVSVRVFTGLDPSIHETSNAYTLELNCISGIAPEDVVGSLDAIAAITVTE